MVLILPVEDVDKTLQNLEQEGEHEKAEGLRTVVKEYGLDASYTFVIDASIKPNGWYIEISKDQDQRPFMKEVANEILNKSPQRGIYTRLILGEDLAEKMARELLELAGCKDPIVYAPIESLYRKYLLLKDEEVRKMGLLDTRIMT